MSDADCTPGREPRSVAASYQYAAGSSPLHHYANNTLSWTCNVKEVNKVADEARNQKIVPHLLAPDHTRKYSAAVSILQKHLVVNVLHKMLDSVNKYVRISVFSAIKQKSLSAGVAMKKYVFYDMQNSRMSSRKRVH